jgi:CelD/BcsL family acetyltransferase involved in cellulose biosynthesis
VNAPTLSVYPSIEHLPPDASALFATDLFASRLWFETFQTAALSPGAEPRFFVLSDSGRTLALLPCEALGDDKGVGNASIAGLTNFYSCDYRPLMAPGADIGATAFALGRALSAHLSRDAVVRFDSLDSTLPSLPPFLDGLSRPGRALLRYAHFGRWSENVAGIRFEAYLAKRDGALREVIRRKGARLQRTEASFEIVPGNEIDRGIADYEAVYARSWKEAEPFPAFQPLLMRKLADAGWLRLGLCRIKGKPVAAQLWVVTNGQATVLKLAHDTEFDSFSPGTVLTAFAIRTLIERDKIAALDFGRGDDTYKRAWTTHRTPHIGVLWTSIRRRPAMVLRHEIGNFRNRGRTAPKGGGAAGVNGGA